jgi:hypothetical protein
MTQKKDSAMNMLNMALDDNLAFEVSSSEDNLTYKAQNGTSGNYSTAGSTYDTRVNAVGYSAWDYWERNYYPYVIKESYPVYLQERATDKGKMAFEIIKMLKDKRFVHLEKVSDFIDCMDLLIKAL